MTRDTTTMHVEGQRVLPTLNADGSRRWIKPRLSIGPFLHARRIVAWFLIALFTVLPHISMNGKPVMLLDVANRRFHVLGGTFLPTDTLLTALLMMTIVLGIFLITAMAGRVWCGWACPQTVYMEFLYRPIERLFVGGPGRRPRMPGPSGLRRFLMYVAFLLASMFLAHTFLAYFVGAEALREWVTRSPLEHPVPFAIMAATTALMLFDFAFFREQTCLIACPYGRIQTAMLDKHSLIITYDENRGEPRGKKNTPESVPLGDCVDCTLCVQTCPTGIDIRDGLQMECIGCAQCIDACNTVMDTLGRERGLIRYASDAMMNNEAKRFFRPRVILYPALIVGLCTLFLFLLFNKPLADLAVLPRQSGPYLEQPSGEITNQVRLRLVNRTDAPATYTFALAPDAPANARLLFDQLALTLEPAESTEVGMTLAAMPDIFNERGVAQVPIRVTDDSGRFDTSISYRMLGPMRGFSKTAPSSPPDQHDVSGNTP